MENDYDFEFNNIFFDNSSDFFSDNDVEELSDNKTVTEEEPDQVFDLSGSLNRSDPSSDSDYVSYLEDIISNQETIISQYESLSLQVQDISDNSFRLYYFIGGLYVAFAIVLAIKFFKMFF